MSELQGLIVPIEARITKLEQGLAKANRAQRRAANQMERRAQQSATRLTRTYDRAGSNIAASFGKLGPALLAGLSVGAITTATSRIRQVVGEVARISDAAATAGVSVEDFQELTYVSDQSRIGVDAMVDSLKELSLRADEFIVTSGGPAAEAFNRLGFRADELKRKLEDPPKLLEEIADRAKDLDSAAQIRIFDELLGGTGAEQLTRLLSGGGDALRNLRQEARDTGAVLDADVIRKAEEIDRKFAALTTRMSNFGKGLAVGLADAAVKIATLRTDLDDLTDTIERAESLLGANTTLELSTDQAALDANKRVVQQIVSEYHRLGEAADQLRGPLFQAAAHLGMLGETETAGELNRVATEIDTLVSGLNDGSISAETFEVRIQELASEAQVAIAQLADIDRVQFQNVTAALGGLVRMMSAAIAMARELRATLPGANPDGTADPSAIDPDATDPRGNQLSPPPRVVPPSPFAPTESTRPRRAPFELGVPDLPSGSGGGSGSAGGGGGGGRSQSDYEREIQSIAEETAALKLEAEALAEVTGARMAEGDAVENARTKAELLAAAQRSGMALTPELRAQIDQLADAYTKANTAADLAADRIAEVQEASQAGAQSIADVFEGLATGALTAEQAVGQLIVQILKLSIQKRFLQMAEGAGGSWLGGFLRILGGGFAEGGYTGDGPKNKPAGVVHKGEWVFSKAATSAIGADNLQRLHTSALRGYADGGLVGAAKQVRSAPSTSPSRSGDVSVSVSAPITIEGRNNSTPEADAELSKMIAKQMEGAVRGVIHDELRRQRRPGNMLDGRR